jgi:hypothetical protein
MVKSGKWAWVELVMYQEWGLEYNMLLSIAVARLSYEEIIVESLHLYLQLALTVDIQYITPTIKITTFDTTG